MKTITYEIQPIKFVNYTQDKGIEVVYTRFRLGLGDDVWWKDTLSDCYTAIINFAEKYHIDHQVLTVQNKPVEYEMCQGHGEELYDIETLSTNLDFKGQEVEVA